MTSQTNAKTTDKLDVPTRRRHNRDLALRLAAAGIPIFPSLNKTPVVHGWQLLDTEHTDQTRADASARFREKHGRDPAFVGCTIDAAKVRDWWRKWPDAVPSISCGPAGLLALDADQHKDGPALLAQWESEHGGRHALAPVTSTRSGGEHVWYRNDPHAALGNAAGAFADMGVDIRGAGGQCVAPGAIREDGARYISAEGTPDLIEAFKSGAVPMLPAPVAKVLREGASRVSNIASLDEARIAKEITKLRETDWLDFDDISDPALGYDLNGLQASDATFAEIWHNPTGDHSEDRFALARCLRRAYGSKFSVVDYASIITGFDGAGTLDDTSRGKGLYNYRDLAREFVKAASMVRSDASQLGAVIDDDDVPPPAQQALAAKKEREKPANVSLKSIRTFLSEYEPVDFLVDGVLERGKLYTMTANTGHGKTCVLSALALAVAAGRNDVLGLNVEKGRVVYATFENPDDFRVKLMASMFAHGCDLESLDGFFEVIDMNATPDAITKRLQNEDGEPYALLVIDTLQAAFTGDDSNNNDEVKKFILRYRAMRNLPGKPAVIIAAHPIKSATREQLVPYGGGSVLNEIDGNLALWLSGSICEMFKFRKWRGMDFGSKFFQLEGASNPAIRDTKGNILSLPVAKARTPEQAAERQATEATKTESAAAALLSAIAAQPQASLADLSVVMGMPKATLGRRVKQLIDDKLLTDDGSKKTLTRRGLKIVATAKAEADKPDERFRCTDEDADEEAEGA